MTNPSSSRGPRGGGALLALLILAGTVVGLLLGQTSLGILGGIALGAAFATLIWWRDRKRG